MKAPWETHSSRPPSSTRSFQLKGPLTGRITCRATHVSSKNAKLVEMWGALFYMH